MLLNSWIYSDEKEDHSNYISLRNPLEAKHFDIDNESKEIVLKLIYECENASSEINDDLSLNIYKSDFAFAILDDRKWLKPLVPFLKKNLLDFCKHLGYNGIEIKGVWFQQYTNMSAHEWHIHQSTNYSGVIYLELPEGSPTTQFYDPHNKEVFNIELSEMDVAIFPSYFPHRSAPNKSNNIKTIISFNFDFLDLDEKLNNKIMVLEPHYIK